MNTAQIREIVVELGGNATLKMKTNVNFVIPKFTECLIPNENPIFFAYFSNICAMYKTILLNMPSF